MKKRTPRNSPISLLFFFRPLEHQSTASFGCSRSKRNTLQAKTIGILLASKRVSGLVGILLNALKVHSREFERSLSRRQCRAAQCLLFPALLLGIVWPKA